MDFTKKRLFLFDIDGTLAVGDSLLPGARALLDAIAARGGVSLFITNNSTRSQMDYVRRFQRVFGLETTADQFVTASVVAAQALRARYGAQTIYAQGTDSFVRELRTFGLQVTTEAAAQPACVVVGYDSELTYEKLCRTAEILQRTGAPFYGTNPDLRCPAPFGFIPDCGAICGMLAATVGREPVYLGKPSARVVEACLAQTGCTPDETLVVGDRLYTDIACGLPAGVDACLFLTGEARMEDLEATPFPPGAVLDGPDVLLHRLEA